jgi:hypothetical protein
MLFSAHLMFVAKFKVSDFQYPAEFQNFCIFRCDYALSGGWQDLVLFVIGRSCDESSGVKRFTITNY